MAELPTIAHYRGTVASGFRRECGLPPERSITGMRPLPSMIASPRPSIG